METEIVNAVIESAHIRIERGFMLDCPIFVRYDAGVQGFCGFALGGTPGAGCGDHSGPNFAAEWITSVLRAADVEDWAKLPDRAIRVRRGIGWNGTIQAIGHITKNDRWFEPRVRFAEMLGKVTV